MTLFNFHYASNHFNQPEIAIVRYSSSSLARKAKSFLVSQVNGFDFYIPKDKPQLIKQTIPLLEPQNRYFDGNSIQIKLNKNNNTYLEQLFYNSQILNFFSGTGVGNFSNSIIQPLPRNNNGSQMKPPLIKSIETLRKVIEDALSNTSVKYPGFLNASDGLSFSPLLFKPGADQLYLTTDLRWEPQNPAINQFSLGYFPKREQFYWVLSDNRIVSETQGIQGGLIYQGLENDIEIRQKAILTEDFSGYQAAWVIPPNLATILKEAANNGDLSQFSVTSIAGQVINPAGTNAAAPVIINNPGIRPSAKFISADQIGIASTYDPKGGGSLFANLPPQNAPLILQGFPTTDLTGLSPAQLAIGAVIPKEVLSQAGISMGSYFTGERPRFAGSITSTPGLKVAQPNSFGSLNLLNILVNPYLSAGGHQYDYLGSLLWLPMGVQPPQVSTKVIANNYYDWYRFYFSFAHNRVKMSYSADKDEASYVNIFSSPGLSFSFNYQTNHVDRIQTLNSSIGLLLGGLFNFLDLDNVNADLAEAKNQANQKKIMESITSKSSAQDRKSINQRLNSTLAYASLNSSLNQISGYVTFPTIITPTQANIFQIRTGNLQRAVQGVGLIVETPFEGDNTITNARFSLNTFGPLSFLGASFPVSSNTSSNQSSAVEVSLVSPNGQQFVFTGNSLTQVPINTSGYALAFDHMQLQRTDTRNIREYIFNGYLYLPTIEVIYSGSSNNFNYGLTTGVWFNLDKNSMPGVADNNYGIPESTIGFYTNAVLTYTGSQIGYDKNNQVNSITYHTPLLKLSWNSVNNNSNPWQANLSYTFSNQNRYFGLSLTGSLAAIENYGNGALVGFINGKLGLPFGFSTNLSFEIGNVFYYFVNMLQVVIPTLSVGPYASNYIDINQGFNSRVESFNYGLIIQHQFLDSPVSFTAQLGISSNGFISSIKGGYRF